jgi:hypothetical protein
MKVSMEGKENVFRSKAYGYLHSLNVILYFWPQSDHIKQLSLNFFEAKYCIKKERKVECFLWSKVYASSFHPNSDQSLTLFLFYSVFQGFSKAKSANGGSILSSSQFLILLQLPQKIKLASKVVKVDSKIIILLPKI